MNDSQFWDKKAQHFQDTMEEGRTETKENLMRYLKENGMVFAKARVMDVGCGTGRYAVEFLKEKMYVTALDISEKMLEFAKINMSSISDKRRQIRFGFCL